MLGNVRLFISSLVLMACAMLACGTAYRWALPTFMPPPRVPLDNAMSDAKVELGRHLFYDKRLSVNGQQACASCHEQRLAFTDGKARSIGTTGDELPRNAMTLANVGFTHPLTWQNPLLATLEEQALVPMFAEAPVELGLTPVIESVLQNLMKDPVYVRLVPQAFAGGEKLTAARVVSAIAAFERTLVSVQSRYDAYVYDKQADALTEQELAGMALFFSERGECYHCHSGVTFSSSFFNERTREAPVDYQNNGLYNLDETGAYPRSSPGLSEHTAKASDHGKFRVPTLRNIAVTAPYMHDGSIATLEEVVEHYVSGGSGEGKRNPNKNPLVRGFVASAEDKAALVAFLKALTDENFLNDPRFFDPWPR